MTQLVLATAVGGAGGGLATCAAAGVALAQRAGPGTGVLLVDGLGERPRAPTMLAASPGRRLEETLRAAGMPGAAARGRLCWLHLEAGLLPGALTHLATVCAPQDIVVAWLGPPAWRRALDGGAPAVGCLLRADPRRQRSLLSLTVRELRGRGLRVRIAKQALGIVASRRALAGLDPGGEAAARSARLAAALVPSPAAGRAAHPAGGPLEANRRPRRSEAGQALPLVLGAAVALIVAALALTAIGGAVTGAGRAQRAADLSALSGARSMRDDLPRLVTPARLPGGAPNPEHLTRAAYLARAEAAAEHAARRNGANPERVAVGFPDRRSALPLRIAVRLSAGVEPAGDGFEVRAGAEAAPPSGYTGLPAGATGGGYSGPLAYRQGMPMRPDVAVAFDRLAAAARQAGHALVITSAYRSDAEQARLFAQNPDPRWVAPPGQSLHRCATELDLGPASAYAWLAANARHFDFLRRYAWEPWHFGYVGGPPPCSPAASRGEADGELRGATGGLPGFVPAAYRAPILGAAARWRVASSLLAAQLMAESGFDPSARSPAGAEGIAQFMPATAAAYGLRDPFDPAAAINAQAHLMSDLLARFGSPPLALAAYNAGAGAVAACGCVPPYPETQAYVARVLGLMDAAGELDVPELEVRLVD